LLGLLLVEVAGDVVTGLVPITNATSSSSRVPSRSAAVTMMSGPSEFTVWNAFAGALGSRSTRIVRSQSRLGVSWRQSASAWGSMRAATRSKRPTPSSTGTRGSGSELSRAIVASARVSSASARVGISYVVPHP
jgi:hypothetical protein